MDAGVSGNAIETLRGTLNKAAFGTESTSDLLEANDALAAVEELYRAAKRYERPFPTDEDREALIAAVRRVEGGE